MTHNVDLGPDDICRCPSGRPYGQCHKPIFDAPEDQRLAVARRLYAEEWAANATAYESQDLYRILAEQLAGAGDIHTVLDIGCGLGNGLAAMRTTLPNGARLIGVDENTDCLVAAAELLGVVAAPQNLHRMHDRVLPSGYHLSTYAGGPVVDQGSVTLVQSDVIVRDMELERLLDTVGPFDAVTLWFSGVHKARSMTELVRHFDIKSDADHRALVEDRALDVAIERVSPGGVLHMVTRVGAADINAVANGAAQEYGQWLKGCPFEIETVLAIPYAEPHEGIRVASPDTAVNTMPNFALSMLIRRAH